MANSLRNALKTSPKLERDGIWLEQGNTKVKLRRAGGSNTEYNAAMAKIATEHGRALKLNLMPDDKANAMLHEVYAEHVVVAWQTLVTGEDGKEVWADGIEQEGTDKLAPVTLENVVAYWKDVPEWFATCKETAESHQGFREALIAHIAGK